MEIIAGIILLQPQYLMIYGADSGSQELRNSYFAKIAAVAAASLSKHPKLLLKLLKGAAKPQQLVQL